MSDSSLDQTRFIDVLLFSGKILRMHTFNDRFCACLLSLTVNSSAGFPPHS